MKKIYYCQDAHGFNENFCWFETEEAAIEFGADAWNRLTKSEADEYRKNEGGEYALKAGYINVDDEISVDDEDTLYELAVDQGFGEIIKDFVNGKMVDYYMIMTDYPLDSGPAAVYRDEGDADFAAGEILSELGTHIQSSLCRYDQGWGCTMEVVRFQAPADADIQDECDAEDYIDLDTLEVMTDYKQMVIDELLENEDPTTDDETDECEYYVMEKGWNGPIFYGASDSLEAAKKISYNAIYFGNGDWVRPEIYHNQDTELIDGKRFIVGTPTDAWEDE